MYFLIGIEDTHFRGLDRKKRENAFLIWLPFIWGRPNYFLAGTTAMRSHKNMEVWRLFRNVICETTLIDT